jgi:CRP-like cAMP-binding protein
MNIKSNFLSTTPLFKEITETEITKILPCLLGEEKTYEKGEFIYRTGDHIHSIGILLSGKISIENDDLWGNKTILNMITPGNVFAESYACIPGEQLMVNIVSISKSQILYLDMVHLLQTCNNNCSYHNKLIRNLLTISAQKNLNLSRRSFHTAAKTIRERLLSYLSYEAAIHSSYEFDIPFNRQQLADYLNLNRSALSNELSKMSRDGFLTVHHNHFVLAQNRIEKFE